MGLFSLIQQVISHIPWASAERRVPIVHFGAGCSYWRRDGYAGRDTVWEYYFEPLIPQHGTDTIPASYKQEITERPLEPYEPWRVLDSGSIACSNFGDHPDLRKQTLKITYGRLDPSGRNRRNVARVIREFIRPRGYIQELTDETFRRELAGKFVIGVHSRGTDALNDQTGLRKNSLMLSSYAREIDRILRDNHNCRIFLATDEDHVVDFFKSRYDTLVYSNDFIRRKPDGPIAVCDSNGWTMPAYFAANSDVAAKNGEEVVRDFLLLCKSDYLVHNGSSVARTVMFAMPELRSININVINTHTSVIVRDYVRRWTTSSWC